MTQSVIALVGVSGVGKSTFLDKLSADIPFQHLQASALIRQARLATGQVGDLRRLDIGENQALLVHGFRAARSPYAELVILDGHSVIDTPTGLVQISPHVFAELGTRAFVFLGDEPAVIHERRSQDSARRRPERSVEELEKQQDAALLAAFQAARTLKVPMFVFSPSQLKEMRAIRAAFGVVPSFTE